MDETHITQAMTEYLAGLWKLEDRGIELTTGALAGYLGVTDTAVSSMTKRLAAEGLVTRLPYRHIQLTSDGRLVGGRLVRHHRLLEVFLIEVLRFTWDQVDAEAHRLEHAVSEAVGDRMEEILGYPTHCPHGDPIPARDGTVRRYQTCALVDLPLETPSVVRRVGRNDAVFLRYLAELGLRPHVTVSVRQHAPFKGPLHLQIEGREQVIGHEVASLIFVEIAESGEPGVPPMQKGAGHDANT